MPAPANTDFLTSIMAVGTVAGALLAAGREKPRFALLVVGGAIFGLGCALAAVAPNYWLFGVALVVIGVSALTFTNSTNSLMQLSTEPAMRGRVMAIRLAIALGCTPIGAPIVGWVADSFGPRWALGVGAAVGFRRRHRRHPLPASNTVTCACASMPDVCTSASMTASP